jgi:hypothetical protein
MRRHKIVTVLGGLLVLGSVGNAIADDKPTPSGSTSASALKGPARTPGSELPPTAAAATAPTPEAVPESTPSAEPANAKSLVEKKTITASRAVSFTRRTTKDPTLKRGKTVVVTRGVPGTERITYEITLKDGIETTRRVVSRTVTVAPVAQVTAVGTKVAAKPKPASSCDPNYAGGCVPIAFDVDCAGGSGNGPAYVSGPVTVIGSDIYGLDYDHDGVGCVAS